MEEIRHLEVEKRRKLEELFQKRQAELQQQINSLESELSKRQAEIEELKRALEKLEFKNVDLAVVKFFLEKTLQFNYQAELKEWQTAVNKLKTGIETLSREVQDLSEKAKKIYEKKEVYDKNIIFYFEGLIDADGSELTIKCPKCQTEFKWDMRNVGLFQNILSCQNENEFRNIYRLVGDSHPVSCPHCSNTIQVRIERLKFEGR
ncbi:hypothetical protein KEJ45_04850 [Candidatus Bathyarchaeota archaeon]|nr:hypothetical protein [Candidatus Bathyarchaeota archaeon]